MNNHRTLALVLRVSDHGESDKIVTFFSPDLGRVTGIAKGAKRSKKRFVNKLEIFSLLEIFYRPPKRNTLFFISEAELENAFLSLRGDFRRYVMATFIVELVLRFTREHDPDPGIFNLLHWAMSSLEKNEVPLKTGVFFLLRLLGAVGYQPALDHCGFCGKKVSAKGSFSLHPGSGSLACSSCKKSSAESFTPLSIQTLKFLDTAQKMELKNIDRLRLLNQNAREALFFLYRYTQHLLQHDINSWQQVKNTFLLKNGNRE